MAKHPRRLIWFCSTEAVAAKPQVLRRLRDEIGLTTIMPESHICHTSGFRASDELLKRGPFEDWRNRRDVWPRGAEGIYPPVAGIVGGFDDTPLLQVIEMARGADLEIWGHIGLWSYGGDVFPEYAMRDIDGRSLDQRYNQWGTGLSPGLLKINEWTRDALVEAMLRYDIDGYCVDHARYPAPANLHALIGCGREECRAEATRLGYDWERMTRSLRRLRSRLTALRLEDLRRLSAARPGFWDVIGFLGDDGAVLEWFYFRARLLSELMAGFGDSVRRAGNPGTVFGSDVFPPSIALLGGHDYARWAEVTDYFTGGSAFGGVVGWATAVTNVAREWVPALCRVVEGLDEFEALSLVYRLFGYEDLNLPTTVAGLEREALPLEEMFRREVTRLKSQSGGRVPLYPPVTATAEPQRVRQLCEVVTEQDCDGAMLTIDPDNSENLDIVGRAFATL